MIFCPFSRYYVVPGSLITAMMVCSTVCLTSLSNNFLRLCVAATEVICETRFTLFLDVPLCTEQVECEPSLNYVNSNPIFLVLAPCKVIIACLVRFCAFGSCYLKRPFSVFVCLCVCVCVASFTLQTGIWNQSRDRDMFDIIFATMI